ncbi:MAG TPA: NAD(+)/NADH kinase [Bryobacteraceae bacterium]|nr:NAD(+)/NADH kinase [Bryobacteraceae bacterium]
MPDPSPKSEDRPEVRVVGIVAKPRSSRAADVLPALHHWLSERGIKVLLDEEAAAYLKIPQGLSRAEVAACAQLVIVLGGDGTLLSTARAAAGRDVPLFAVNLGGLGFLTAIKVDELYLQLERALKGDFLLERRRLLSTELWRGDQRFNVNQALNDMVLSKTDIARMIDLDVRVDGSFLCTYRADGLIVATPTGSTAYSLSAGGPIVYPTVAAIAITPICPHTLTNRPVIVPDESVIEVTIPADVPSAYMTIDGQVGETVLQGDRIVCRRSEQSISLVHPPEMVFFDVLREKLKWGGR